MFDDVKQSVTDKVQQAKLNKDPFPYLYIQDFFPADFYTQLDSLFPTQSQLTSITNKAFKPVSNPVQGRSTLTIFNREVEYKEMEGYPYSKQSIEFRLFVNSFLVPLIASKLEIQLPTRWDDDTRFVLDQMGYVKHPHTDHPMKTFSILIYMSNSLSGTSILRPKQLGFMDDYGNDHPFRKFDEVFNPPFVPNALLAFPRTNTSFHSVTRLRRADEYRKAIHINVRPL